MRHIHILFLILIFFLIDMGFGALLRPYYRAVTLPEFERFYTRFVAQDAPPFDIVFIGDSRIQHGVDTRLISILCDCRAGNLAVSGSNAITNYYLVRDYLAIHTPDMVVLEAHWSRMAPQKAGNQYPYLLEMKPYADQWEYFTESRDLSFAAEKILKSYAYRNALGRFLRGDFPVQVMTADATPDSFDPRDAALPPHGSLEKQVFNTLGAFDRERDTVQATYLGKTIELLQSKGVAVVLFQPPELTEVQARITHFDELHEAIEAVAARYHVPYSNFARGDAAASATRDLFADVLHLNSTGAALYSRMLWEEMKRLR